ncbi:MAG: hypothetical protein M1820_000707 [Bogoriella megaspora]|nr:MAG: hypothetical protein M1820_000707 [Bogoriella megaspora]
MGKLVLDGVVNSHEYYNGLQYSASVDTDAVFQGFVSSCVAAPHQCPLARSDSTNGSVTNEILNFLEGLKNNSEVSEPQRSIYAPVKLLITSNLKAPLKWPILATALHQILTGDSQAFKATASQLDEGSPIFPSNSNASEAQAAIECSDLTQRINDAQKIEQLSEAFEEQSFWGGGYGGLYLALCAHWRFTAKETYLGDFQVRTKNPILFIGNTYDPITPLVSAQNMSTGFEGSVVLEQHSYGHTSLSQPSLCTAKVIQTYFQTGELPPKGKKCEPEFAPFKSNATFVDIFANATELNKRASRQTKMTEGRYLVL